LMRLVAVPEDEDELVRGESVRESPCRRCFSPKHRD
jgi:hypothetical protein